MGYAVKGKTIHTYAPGRTITGKGAKAGNAWAWELCKAGKLASWSHTKSEGFRLALTNDEHRANFGQDSWAELPTMNADAFLERLAAIDPTGTHIPAGWDAECRKHLAVPVVPAWLDPDPAPKRRGSVVRVRALLAELSDLDLSEESRALLDLIGEVAA
jgi:hypothetical protein